LRFDKLESKSSQDDTDVEEVNESPDDVLDLDKLGVEDLELSMSLEDEDRHSFRILLSSFFEFSRDLRLVTTDALTALMIPICLNVYSKV